MAAHGPSHEQVRQDQASADDGALLADRRRQAALRLVEDRDGSTTTSPEVPADPPLFEASTSAIGDVDAAGDRLVVWADRVELHDGRGRLRARLAVEAIDQVTVRRRLTASVLTVLGTDGDALVLKGVRPAAAARFREAVATLKLSAAGPAGPAGASPTAEALRRIDELAAMGLLTEAEVAEKRSLIARRAVDRRA